MRVIGEMDTLAKQRALLKANPSALDVFKDARAFKAFALDEVKQGDPERRQLRFTITTSTKDRMSDTIAADGWKLDSYKRNPVILYAHNYHDLPIGRAVTVEPQGEKLMSVGEFATKEQYPFADTVYQLLLGKFLNAVSVGFDPLKWVFNEDSHGIDFKEQDLLEYSVVPVPANPEALVEARAAGIDMAPVREWLERAMDEFHPDGWLVLPKEHMERARTVLAEAKLISIPAPKSTEIRIVGAMSKEEINDLIAARVADQLKAGAFDEALRRTFPQPPPAGGSDEPEIALWLEPDAPTREEIFVDAGLLREAVRDVVGETVRAQFNRLRGRVD